MDETIPSHNSIAKLENATRALEEVKELSDILGIKDIAQAAVEYARAAKLGLEAQNRAAEVKLRAERKAGSLLAELQRGTAGRKSKDENISVRGDIFSPYGQAIDSARVTYQTAGRYQQVASIPEDDFENFIQDTKDAGEELTTNRALRLEKELQRNVVKEERKNNATLPNGKYRVVYADPPWKYSNAGVIGSDNYGRVARHYPSMSLEELCEFGQQIKPILENDAVLFLWVTSPILAECWSVIEAWGFTYKSSFVWDKVKHNFGHYNSMRHEFLLVCTKGSCTPDTKELHDSVISIEKSDKHSEKPEYFRQLIDGLYTYGRRIELFSRTTAEGWDTWGNEPETY